MQYCEEHTVDWCFYVNPFNGSVIDITFTLVRACVVRVVGEAPGYTKTEKLVLNDASQLI